MALGNSTSMQNCTDLAHTADYLVRVGSIIVVCLSGLLMGIATYTHRTKQHIK